MNADNKFAQAAKEMGKGYLSGAFQNDVHEKAKEAELRELEGEKSGTIAGRLTRQYDREHKAGGNGSEREKKKQERDFINTIIMRSVQEQLKGIDDIVAMMREEAKRLREEAARLREEFTEGLPRMAELSALIEQEEKFLKDYETTQRINRAAWIKFLQQQGKDANEKTTDADLIRLMKKARADHQKEYDDLHGKEERANEKDRQAEEMENKADALHKRKQEIEKLPPDKQAEALKTFWKDVPEEVLRKYEERHEKLDEFGQQRKDEINADKAAETKIDDLSVLDDLDDLQDQNNKAVPAMKLPGLGG